MDILQVIRLLISKNIETKLRGVLAHLGVKENEKADKAAKESKEWELKKHWNNYVVGENTNRAALKVVILPLKAAIRAVHKQLIDCWQSPGRQNQKEKSSGHWLLPPALRFYSYTKGLKNRKVHLLHR